MASPLAQLKEIWSRLPQGGRFAVIGAAIGTLALIGALVYYGSQPEYGVLFSDLKAGDAQAIVEKLKTANVQYSLSDNGTTISVPSDRVTELRLQMAGDGAISGGHVGFDLFDKTSFGATDFTQQVNYRRAIEGELAKTIEGMDEVETARVHITPKKDSIYAEKEEGAKASVMLRVKQSKELTEERTDAIVSLVSSSVEGLDPSQVSVMDTRGRLLTAAGRTRGGFGEVGAFNAQLASRQKFEAETAARIVSLLEPLTGEGKVRADVSADVDFSQIEQTEEKYNPQSQVIRSQQSTQETRNSSRNNQNVVGVGARANDPTTPQQQPAEAPAAQTGQSNNDQRVATTTNYEIDKTVRRTIGGGGRINRLSVSVLVDNKIVNDVQTVRTEEELKKMQELVGAAVGASEQRGDAVVVQSMPFDKPQLENAAPKGWADAYQQHIPTLIKYAALVFIAFLLLLFVVRPARRALKAAAAAAAPAENEPMLLNGSTVEAELLLPERRSTDGSGQNALNESTQTGQLGAMKTVAEMEAEMDDEIAREIAAAAKPKGEAQRSLVIKKMVEDQVMKEPENVASTIRGWLHERPVRN